MVGGELGLADSAGSCQDLAQYRRASAVDRCPQLFGLGPVLEGLRPGRNHAYLVRPRRPFPRGGLLHDGQLADVPADRGTACGGGGVPGPLRLRRPGPRAAGAPYTGVSCAAVNSVGLPGINGRIRRPRNRGRFRGRRAAGRWSSAQTRAAIPVAAWTVAPTSCLVSGLSSSQTASTPHRPPRPP